MSAPEEAAIRVTTEDGVRRVVLDRPEAANALRPVDRDAVIAALVEADADPTVRVVVLAANGRHFCAGADVKVLAAQREATGGEKRVGDAMRRIMTGAQALIGAILDCAKPVVAVVQGPATGVGAHLAFAADLVVAAEEAVFIESFVKRGLVMDGGGAYLLPRRIGMQKAKEMAFFGEPVSAAEALCLGLVNRVVPAAELQKSADDLVSRFATAPTGAISFIKRLLNDSPDVDRTAAFLAEAMAQELQSHSHDSDEGVRAFVERRPPEYLGH